MDNVYWYYRLEWCFFLIKAKQLKKRKKIKTQETHQIGMILSICRKSDPKSWQHPRAAARGTWDHDAAPAGRRMEQWDRGRDTSDVDCTTHIQLLLTVFFIILLLYYYFWLSFLLRKSVA